MDELINTKKRKCSITNYSEKYVFPFYIQLTQVEKNRKKIIRENKNE